MRVCARSRAVKDRFHPSASLLRNCRHIHEYEKGDDVVGGRLGFIGRKLFSNIFRFVSRNISKIINFIFSAFGKMPVRVGLAIVGSILLTIAFAVGFIWSWIAMFEQEELTNAAQNSLTVILVIVLIWISIATFIPSLERQPEVVHVTESYDSSIVEITPRETVSDDDEAELVE